MTENKQQLDEHTHNILLEVLTETEIYIMNRVSTIPHNDFFNEFSSIRERIDNLLDKKYEDLVVYRQDGDGDVVIVIPSIEFQYTILKPTGKKINWAKAKEWVDRITKENENKRNNSE